MILNDVLEELKHSELASANLGDNEHDGISPYNYPKLVNYVNAALLAIYSKYPLSQRQVIVRLKEGQYLYKLDSEFAESNTNSNADKYLVDDSDPFDNLLIKIDEVYTEMGIQLPLNDPNDEASLFRQSYNTLRVPNPTEGTLLSVWYRARHPYLLEDTPNGVEEQSINLSDVFLPAIVMYVVYKYKSSWETATSQQEAANALQMFTMELERLNSSGLIDSDLPSSPRFGTNGWV